VAAGLADLGCGGDDELAAYFTGALAALAAEPEAGEEERADELDALVEVST
jgi:hypothetical protein